MPPLPVYRQSLGYRSNLSVSRMDHQISRKIQIKAHKTPIALVRPGPNIFRAILAFGEWDFGCLMLKVLQFNWRSSTLNNFLLGQKVKIGDLPDFLFFFC